MRVHWCNFIIMSKNKRNFRSENKDSQSGVGIENVNKQSLDFSKMLRLHGLLL